MIEILQQMNHQLDLEEQLMNVTNKKEQNIKKTNKKNKKKSYMKTIQKYLQNIVQLIQKGIINLIYYLMIGWKQGYRSCGNHLRRCCFDIDEKPLMSEYERKKILLFVQIQ